MSLSNNATQGTTADISTLSAGGVANAAAQDSFCASTTCVISIIYDQSANANHLTPAPPGGAASGPGPNGFDIAASAVGAPVFLNGRKAYGVFIEPTSGYRNNAAKGTATGDGPQGMYAVFDGTHYNSNCCFDYGNAEVNNDDNGNGHMEAIYFGSNTGYSTGTGNGPWVMADLENGLYSWNTTGPNPNEPSSTSRFVTATVKGKPGIWALRGGDSTTGSLTTYWNASRPSPGYSPMSKEGAIILGIGGDNSNGAQGTFYEGCMTSGYPLTASENAVQSNIVGARYSVAPLVSGPAFKVGSTITLRATTSCCTGDCK